MELLACLRQTALAVLLVMVGIPVAMTVVTAVVSLSRPVPKLRPVRLRTIRPSNPSLSPSLNPARDNSRLANGVTWTTGIFGWSS